MKEKNIIELIEKMGFVKNDTDNKYEKRYREFDKCIIIDFDDKKIIYPSDVKINDKTTCNFDKPENFVVLECINRLLEKGYRPEHLELEKRWNLGHESKGGKADICVYDKDGINVLCIIECKTYGQEYNKELKNLLNDGGQLFSYWQQERETKWLVIYSSRLSDGQINYQVDSVNCSDDANILELSKKDNSISVYTNSNTVEELYNVWKETYDKALYGDVLFSNKTQAYNIGIKPLTKKDLVDFEEDNKIVNKFEEILRHNNVSDKENAFNRLIALFICKLVDEMNKNDDDIVDFQYKHGTDTYESLQDRLQRLHKQGMDDFMKEEIFYVSDDYAEELVKTYTGQNRENMINELKSTLKILKFYTNNDFSFKDVHNEELFYQNGKVVVEMVELFQKYRIIGSNNLQLLGDLFEQLLNKGFKQNEGQFFTPVPITRFIWECLPLKSLIVDNDTVKYPKVVDYACGSGHFLTEGFEKINNIVDSNNKELDKNWVEQKLFGIEKDYRLARVSKISLFMHGAGNGNIIYGDGLDNYSEKNITSNSFDILVANPPYSVSSFKPHLKLKNNSFDTLDKISNEGSEIETLFVERISQLVKPNGYAAVILPSQILSKDGNSFISSRESILKNFNIKSIVRFGSKTFGATGQNTIVLFLQKFNEPPRRVNMVEDSVNAIFSNKDFKNFEDNTIINEYVKQIDVTLEKYLQFIEKVGTLDDWKEDKYFKSYVDTFTQSTTYKTKIKKSSFKKLDEIEKIHEINNMFYTYATEIEKEKMRYFGYVYTQKVLIVYGPDDNKEQENFLGYKWSDRKGKEGIQLLTNKGILCSSQNDNKSISTFIRNSFDNIENDEMNKYCYYQDLKDMINFETTSFNKTIKITKIRKLKKDSTLKTLSLSDKELFDVSIGDRVLATELKEKSSNTIPVYSANVKEVFGYIDKRNREDFSKDSILWGIDGDWMTNVIDKNIPFYPTDHCGVLKYKADDINSWYLAFALEAAGSYEKFSRTNRASSDRVGQLKIQVPKKDIQEKVVNEIREIDKKININNNKIKEEKKKIIDLFTNKFNAAELIKDGSTTSIKKEKISTICVDGRGRIINNEYIDLNPGNYPVYSSQTSNDGIFGYINSFDFDGEYITWTTDGVNAGTVFYRNGKFNCTNVCGTLKLKETKSDTVNMIYLSVALGIIAPFHVTHSGNNKLMNDAMKNIYVPIPSIEEQNEFAKDISKINNNINKYISESAKLYDEREKKFDKYFKD